MKALSIRQPFADAILIGHGMTNPNVAKRVENRSHRTAFRGEFLVHAGQAFDVSDVEFVMDRYFERKIAAMRPLLSVAPHRRGALLGTAAIIDCLPINDVVDLAARGQMSIYANGTVRNLEPTAAAVEWALQRAWAFGPWCWIIDRPRWFRDPIPWKGKLGFFDVPDDVVAGAL